MNVLAQCTENVIVLTIFHKNFKLTALHAVQPVNLKTKIRMNTLAILY